MMNPAKRIIIDAVRKSPSGNSSFANCFCEALEIAENPDEMKKIFEIRMAQRGHTAMDIKAFYFGLLVVAQAEGLIDLDKL